ncbi:alpha/beta hydrolase [Actinocorallia sp. B10E7]|uniref:alpha/beta hydrolase n=1 Tax=Actinocorallia sp. B10E7 TaxID=3153558 RepID=UPI00325CFB09
MKKLIGASAAAGLVLAGLALPAQASAAAPQHRPVKWGSCGQDLVDYAALYDTLKGAILQCAKIKVPLDHNRPRGEKITLALSRIKHTGAKKGTLVVNPGGPGGTGTDFAVPVAGRASAKLRAAYDIVGFDPRGTGGSGAMSCDADHFDPVRPDYNPKNKGDIAYWLKEAKDYAKACGKKYGRLLKHMKTTDSARDMELIRQRLNDRKLNFYGASYGTYLGGVYATLFPRKVGRMVLDSNVAPSGVWYDANLEQDKAFDRNLNIFFGWVAKHNDVYKVGATRKEVRAFYYKTRAELAAKPVSVALDPAKPAELTKVGPSELEDSFLTAGYRASSGIWGLLATALADRKAGSDTGIANAYVNLGASAEADGYAVYSAVQCTDVQWPRKWKTWKRDAERTAAKHPFMTWNNTWYNSPCLYWPAKAGKPVDVRERAGLPDILLFQATLDAATPYAGGPELRKRLGGHLVVEDGGLTHGVVQRGNAKIDAYFENYLLTGRLPKRKVVHVDALPKPQPPAAEARTQGAPADEVILGRR